MSRSRETEKARVMTSCRCSNFTIIDLNNSMSSSTVASSSSSSASASASSSVDIDSYSDESVGCESASHDTPNIGNKRTCYSLPTPAHPQLLQQRRRRPQTTQQRPSLSVPKQLEEETNLDRLQPRAAKQNSSILSAFSHSRFRSLADYSSFQPQALDCFTSHSKCIGAMASTHSGIILVPLTTLPYQPLLILRHVIPSRTISSLKFQPSASPQWLASASSHSILIWDISGQSMNPLITRLDTPPPYHHHDYSNNYQQLSITSMAWKQQSTILFAAGPTSISMYDLRSRNRSSNRPQQQWTPDSKLSSNPRRLTTLCSIATPTPLCNTIVVMDSSGLVRFFDDRFLKNDTVLDSFAAHTGTGIGMDFNTKTCMTWGLEEQHDNPCVKVWKPANSTTSSSSSSTQYHCTSHVIQPFLSCARVGPKDTFLTLQSSSESGEEVGDECWSASVWSIQNTTEEIIEKESIHGVLHMTTFHGLKDDMVHLGIKEEPSSWKQDHLIAAELACSFPVDESGGDSSETLLCCLGSTGYLSTFSVPEMDPFDNIGPSELSLVQEKRHDKVDKTIEHTFLNHLHNLWTHHENEILLDSNPLHTDGKSDQESSLWSQDDILNGDPYHVDGVSLHFQFHHEPHEQDPSHSDKIPVIDSSSQTAVDPYKAMRVPSPRLCGASFSMEKLVVFTNGSLMESWSWFTSDQNIENDSLKVRVDPLNENPQFETTEMIMNQEGILTVNETVQYQLDTKAKAMESPHTYLDFCRMKEAILMARNGNVSQDPGIDENINSDNAATTDDDDSCTDASDESNRHALSSSSNSSIDGDRSLYAHYFSRGSRDGLDGETKARTHIKQIRPRLKPSTYQENGTVKQMKFINSSIYLVTESMALAEQSFNLAQKWLLGSWGITHGNETDPTNRQMDENAFSSNQYRVHEKVDPTHAAQNINARNESMVDKLQNVIYHNQKRNSIVGIPIDQRFMQKGKKSEDQSPHRSMILDKDGISLNVSFNVEIKPCGYAHRHLSQVRHICTYNSEVSRTLGFSQKADIWQLLATVVDNILNGCYDDFDGWKGLGGSIGHSLLSNILQFYEKMGDVQMLATIICVFYGGRDRKQQALDPAMLTRLDLLLPNDDSKFDNYIFLYGSILYRWGLIDIQTELNKHLASTKLCEADTNICYKCKSLICCLCVLPVRGAFLICRTCGHGGHVQHMLPWFHENATCATGCGCSCIY